MTAASRTIQYGGHNLDTTRRLELPHHRARRDIGGRPGLQPELRARQQRPVRTPATPTTRTTAASRATAAPRHEYSAMSYTSSRFRPCRRTLQDTPISQEVFLPFNATCIDDNGRPRRSGTSDELHLVPHCDGHRDDGQRASPNIYHAWTSVLDTPPAMTRTSSADDALAASADQPCDQRPPATTASRWTPCSGTARRSAPRHLRHQAPQTARAPPPTNGQSTAHKGYAVQLAVPVITEAPLPPRRAATSTDVGHGRHDRLHADRDPGSTAASFSIPLFKLDPSYANQSIDVDIFDIGDVNFQSGHAGAAYVGIQEPGGTTFATATMTALGDSLDAKATRTVNSAWGNGACGSAGSACFRPTTSAGPRCSTANGSSCRSASRVTSPTGTPTGTSSTTFTNTRRPGTPSRCRSASRVA